MPITSFASSSTLRSADFSPPRHARRRLLVAALAAPALGFVPPALAGTQQYEPLADAVQAALAAQIADSRPPMRSFGELDDRFEHIDWLEAMSQRLTRRKPAYRERIEFLRTVDYECARAGLDRQLVLALIQVESNFRKYAISSAGARGYMQVMPFWTRVIGDGDERRLFDMRSNLRYGCVILRHYLDLERGNLFLALGRYNGSRGRDAYPNLVLSAWRSHWDYKAAGRSAA